MKLAKNGWGFMEIKKTKNGWEYDEISFTDEHSAMLAKRESETEMTKKIRVPKSKNFKLVYDSENKKSFGVFIEKILRSQNKSVVEMSAEFKVSRQTLFSWMNGESVPTRNNLAVVLNVTGCHLEEIKLALRDNFERHKVALFEGLSESRRA